MSLINDMLKDLDRRGARDPGRARAGNRGDRERALGQGGPPRFQLSAWLPAVGAFVLVAGLVLWEQQGASTPEPATKAAQVQAEKPVVLVPNLYPELLAAMKPPEPVRNATESRTSAVADSAMAESESPELSALAQAQIKQLLAEAELAFERDRLTSPIEDNAYARYRKVLELAPDHEKAQAGLERITRRYLDLAEDYIEQGEALRAQVLIRRAETVQEAHPDIPQVTQRLEAMPGEKPSSANDKEPSSANDKEPSREQVAAERVSTGQVGGASVTRGNDNADAAAGDTDQHLDVSPNAAFQDQRVARQARELLRDGRHHSARLRLEKVLETYPRPVNSATLLADVYIDQGDTSAAQTLLDEVDYLPAVEQARLNARLALALGEQERAVTLLETELAQAAGHESYRAMLAGLYYRVGRHPEAATSYRRLLDEFGGKPGYWLGLALALDAQDQDASALESFRRALAGSGYDAPEEQEVRTYIEQRIAALTGNQ